MELPADLFDIDVALMPTVAMPITTTIDGRASGDRLDGLLASGVVAIINRSTVCILLFAH
ncbi:MAG: hypothetical protein ABFC77_14850 [Thermoguttaceae bacterium]